MSGIVKRRHRLWCPVLAVAAFPWMGTAQSVPASDSLYVVAKASVEDGEQRRGLEQLAEAWSAVEFSREPNPALGLEYIRLATAMGAVAHYDRATDAYLWALSGTVVGEELEDEYARIRPILPPGSQERLDELVDAEDPTLMLELRRFWIEADPSPGTSQNERLTEHWERIAFARANFTMGRNSPYGTDDRGTSHVRFGAPQEKWEGSLGASENELRMWVGNLLVREQLRRYDTYPRYEVWIYDILDKEEFAYILFGNRDGSGPFEEVEGVEDLIPHQAKSAASRLNTPNGVRASHFLRLFYYSDLDRIGGPFARRFSELNIEWSRAQARGTLAPHSSALEAAESRFRQEDRIHRGPEDRVAAASVFDSTDASLDMVSTVMRILGPNDEPQLRIVSLSAPHVHVDDVAAWFADGRGEASSVRQYAIVRDENLDVVGQVPPTAVSDEGDVATYLLRHPSRSVHLTLVAEARRPELLRAPDVPGERREEPRAVRGGENVRTMREAAEVFPSRRHILPTEPLTRDPEVLEVSDLVTGIALPEAQMDPALGLPLIPSTSVRASEPFRLYYEAYHLGIGEQGSGRYQAEIRIEGWDPEEGVVLRQPEPIAVAYDVDVLDPTDRRVFDLAVSNLREGTYRLSVILRDQVRGQTKERQTTFSIHR